MGEDNILDSILGKDELKQEIAELKDEVEDLENENEKIKEKLERVESKRKEAVTDKQDAYKEKNRLEDKMHQLQDKLERLESDSGSSSTEIKSVDLTDPGDITGIFRLLNNIEYSSQVARTISIRKKEHLTQSLSDLEVDTSKVTIGDLVLTDEYGIINCSMDLPIPYSHIDHQGTCFTLRRENFLPTDDYYFGILRSDTFAIGRYEKWERKNIRTVRSRVGENHSKGGFSQSRFENRRDKQIDEHLKDSKQVVEDFYDDEERLIIVGDEQVLDSMEKYADYTDTTDATGSPTESLEEAFSKFWRIKIRRL